MTRQFGETWVYESLVGALPGLDLPPAWAVGIQFALFEALVLVLGWYYDLRAAMIAGTVAVVVAAVGSAAMHALGNGNRRLDAPATYTRLLFGTSIEVVLAVLSFVGLVTYLFAFAPEAGGGLFERLFGPDPPVAVVYLTLLILWDLCYRIATSWWSAVVALWRGLFVDLDAANRRLARRLDAINVGFAAVQLALVPFVLAEPILLVAVLGHVVAVLVVTTAATILTGSG